MRNFYSVLTLILLSVLISRDVTAQMFSVDGNQRQQTSIPSTYVRTGVSPTEFTYKGNLTGAESPASLEFSNPSFYLALESPGLSLTLNVSNRITGADQINYLGIALELSDRFALIRSNRFIAGIPIQLNTSLTNINQDTVEDNFNQGSFGVSSGGFFRSKLGEKVLVSGVFTPGYSFTSTNAGFVGGSVFSLEGGAQINFLNLIGGRALSLGYNYTFRSFDVDQELYDFDLSSHTISLGISL